VSMVMTKNDDDGVMLRSDDDDDDGVIDDSSLSRPGILAVVVAAETWGVVVDRPK